jgi:hypothetical protein
MPGKDYKSLRDVAKEIQSNLQKYAPYKTGNLRNQLRTANTVNTIIGRNNYDFNSETKSVDIDISVEVAPSGAKYGLWFNDPPAPQSKRRKSLQKTAERKGNWNFGQRSIDDAIYKYLDKFADEIAENMAQSIEDRLSKL